MGESTYQAFDNADSANIWRLIGTIQESYSGERVVKVYDGYDYEIARFRDVNERLRSLTLKAQKVYSAGTPLTQFASMAGVSIVIVFA